ncbi:MAG: alpha/beta hydrolase [Cyanobacteria bacterium SZAS-4]|nr:alpha/beta hydrolase [Cyanobacteria bacterium SZAS-4]
MLGRSAVIKFKLSTKHAWFLILILALSAVSIGKSLAATRNDKFVSIPVFYATDRATNQESFKFESGRRFYHRDEKKPLKYLNKRRQAPAIGLDYGCVNVTVPTPDTLKNNLTEQQKLKAANWSFSNDGSNKWKCKLIGAENTSLYIGDPFENFWKDFKASLPEPNSRIIVFVHGFNNDFKAALLRAARLSAASQEPVVIFSWPAKSNSFLPLTYVQDQVNNEWAQEDFDSFMQKLEKKDAHSAIDIVAHSMGNRIVLRNIRSHYQPWMTSVNPCSFRYHSTTFLSPDIDEDIFTQNNLCYRFCSRQTSIFSSKKDSVLKLSEILNDDTRAGREAGPSMDKINFYDFSAFGEAPLGHGPPIEIIGRIVGEKALTFPVIIEPDKDKSGSFRLAKWKYSKEREWAPYLVAVRNVESPDILETRAIHLRTEWSKGIMSYQLEFDSNNSDYILYQIQKLKFINANGHVVIEAGLQAILSSETEAGKEQADGRVTCTLSDYLQCASWQPGGFKEGFYDAIPPDQYSQPMRLVQWTKDHPNLQSMGVRTSDAIDQYCELSKAQRCILRTLYGHESATSSLLNCLEPNSPPGKLAEELKLLTERHLVEANDMQARLTNKGKNLTLQLLLLKLLL